MRGLLIPTAALLLCVWPAVGCGSVYYTVSVSQASSKLEEARQMGAETKAPYEYTFAKEHLRQAQIEAAEASYSDAAGYAETAELYAQKAIEHVQSSKKGGK